MYLMRPKPKKERGTMKRKKKRKKEMEARKIKLDLKCSWIEPREALNLSSPQMSQLLLPLRIYFFFFFFWDCAAIFLLVHLEKWRKQRPVSPLWDYRKSDCWILLDSKHCASFKEIALQENDIQETFFFFSWDVFFFFSMRLFN